MKVEVFLADQALSLKNAMVRIYKNTNDEIVYENFFVTKETGSTVEIPLYAPPRALSLEEANDERPYETYNVEVRIAGFDMQEVVGVQIFAGETSYLPVNLIPNRNRNTNIRMVSALPDHHLLTNYGGNNEGQTPPTTRILGEIIIPTNITVHLGRPDNSSAENVTVPFLYYLKNVASSEVYPSWPYEAIKANVWCQMSLALNRIYTEWYPSKGYDFDITNSTAFDQAFVKDRNIFDTMSNIVDEVFGDYIQKANFTEPYYAEYCDGKQAQCPGLKQWGTVDLANRGYTAFRILQYYYGDNITIQHTDNFQDLKSSYPGTPFRIGSSGQQVAQIQEQLNAIAINYPIIPEIFPVDGVFGETTEEAVRAFQRQFNLAVDGVVGKGTYYKISYIYAAVRKLAELGSLGQINNLYSGEWPGTILREGDKGVEVQLVQYYLSSISLFYQQIPSVSIDGRFGRELANAVTSFQRAFQLIPDGVIGMATWNRIFQVYSSLDNQIVPADKPPQYPGRPIALGGTGTIVENIQNALNTVSSQYPAIPVTTADGIFGQQTQNAVKAFQKQFNLTVDGIVGLTTWNKLFTIAAQINMGDQPANGLPPFPGTTLRVGSRGNDVLLMQNRLKFISIYYNTIPNISADGIFGNATRNAVIAFQQLMGLTPDGLIGVQTWNLINNTYSELMSSSYSLQ